MSNESSLGKRVLGCGPITFGRAIIDSHDQALIALVLQPGSIVTKDSQELRRVMGHFATGVTVITTADRSGTPFGLTANAFTSLSLDPPLVLICIDKGVQCYPCFEESKIFAVNLLKEDQEHLSRRFATKGIEKFAGIQWHKGKHGTALLDGALGHIECKVVRSYDGGDHTIYIGEVVGASASGDRPLIFFKGKYQRLPQS